MEMIKIGFTKFNTGLSVAKDRLGRLIKQGDLIARGGEVWYVSLFDKGEWWICKVVDRFYSYLHKELLPLEGRFMVERKTYPLKESEKYYILEGVNEKVENLDASRELITGDDDRIWYFDKLGRDPMLGEIILYQAPGKDESTLEDRLGIISYMHPKSCRLHMTRLIIPKNVEDLGNLRMVGSQIDLNMIRSRYDGIIILRKEIGRGSVVSGSLM